MKLGLTKVPLELTVEQIVHLQGAMKARVRNIEQAILTYQGTQVPVEWTYTLELSKEILASITEAIGDFS